MDTREKIKKIRKEKGLTQKQLGELLGTSQQMIAQYEKGERNPKQKTLKKIARALDVTIFALLDESWEETAKDKMEDSSFDSAVQTANLTLENLVNNAPLSEIEKCERNILLSYYKSLNDKGKSKVVQYVQDLTQIPEYKKEGK